METLMPKQRSERMSRVRSKDTKPELAVRRLIHGMGLRYRLHRRNLPGSPDLVFSSRRKVIFVHGYFTPEARGPNDCGTGLKVRNKFQGSWKPISGICCGDLHGMAQAMNKTS